MIEEIARLSLAGVAVVMSKRLKDQRPALRPVPVSKQYRRLARIEEAVRRQGL